MSKELHVGPKEISCIFLSSTFALVNDFSFKFHFFEITTKIFTKIAKYTNNWCNSIVNIIVDSALSDRCVDQDVGSFLFLNDTYKYGSEIHEWQTKARAFLQPYN